LVNDRAIQVMIGVAKGYPAFVDASDDQSSWIEGFHAGDRALLEACYRDHYAAVERAVGQVLVGADRDTVVHEVFFRVLSSGPFRQNFRGGTFRAWLTTAARNQAIDHYRRWRREGDLEEAPPVSPDAETDWQSQADARLLVERFRKEQLPAKWAAVFEARFLRQLNQRDAARELGMSRTTLAYQEMRIRSLLERFLLGGTEQ
jgi:RNA polymerase sigma-70 factor (ECF subfamily)